MKARFVVFAVIFGACAGWIGLQAQGQPKSPVVSHSSLPSAAGATDAQALLNRYCVTCHNARMKAGSLVLESADLSELGQDAATWEKVVRKLRGRMMPPVGRPRPDEATYTSLVNWLEHGLDSAAAAHPNPGRTETFRRLNRTEYQNAVRDLLALDVDVSGFVPADDSAFGFDNIGGVFKLSGALMESYLAAAKTISRMTMGTTPPEEGKVFAISRRIQQFDRVDGLGLGTRGGALVHYLFPQDGVYSFKINMGLMAIISETHTMELAIDGVQAKTYQVAQVGSPLETQFYGDKEVIFETRLPLSAGPHDVGVTFFRSSTAVSEALLDPLQISSGSNFGGGNLGPGGAIPIVTGITIGGPFDAAGPGETPSRRRILTCHPSIPAAEAPCARTIVATLAKRAFRRPLSEGDMNAVMSFYTASRANGEGFEAAIEKVVRRILASPEFLFRVETEPAAATLAAAGRPAAAPAALASTQPGVYRISALELASRLSFFLWSSIPDDQLLDLAIQGRLQDPQVLTREVRRMLADPRSMALTTSFAAQWLQLRKLESSRPGGDYAKNFDETLKKGLRRETELFVDSIIREDRPVTDLINANYTFLNERVAQHYDIRDVQGAYFRRVTLPAASPRRGLLGQGSILTLTSQAIRTSPVARGKYILEELLGTPPPEPPPNVPSLTEGKAGTRPSTMRERMAAHRANPACAGCHAIIDPLGFGLESFDPVGAWRDLDQGRQAVDASGSLPDGRKFGGFAELRSLLAQRPEQITTTITEKMLTYALGRGLEPYDMPALRKIVAEAARNDYHVQSIVFGIVTSYPFQMRTVRAVQPTVVADSR